MIASSVILGSAEELGQRPPCVHEPGGEVVFVGLLVTLLVPLVAVALRPPWGTAAAGTAIGIAVLVLLMRHDVLSVSLRASQYETSLWMLLVAGVVTLLFEPLAVRERTRSALPRARVLRR